MKHYFYFLKFVSTIFYQIFIFHQMIVLQKLWKIFFISSKKIFSFLRYSNFFLFLSSPLFLPVSHCFRGCSKINLKVYDVINCLNKNFLTHFVRYLRKEKGYGIKTLSMNRVLNKEHFYGKSCRRCTPKAYPRPLLILVNNPKQPSHARNFSKYKNILKKGYQKVFKNLTLFFLLNPNILMDKVIKSKRGLELVTN